MNHQVVVRYGTFLAFWHSRSNNNIEMELGWEKCFPKPFEEMSLAIGESGRIFDSEMLQYWLIYIMCFVSWSTISSGIPSSSQSYFAHLFVFNKRVTW